MVEDEDRITPSKQIWLRPDFDQNLKKQLSNLKTERTLQDLHQMRKDNI